MSNSRRLSSRECVTFLTYGRAPSARRRTLVGRGRPTDGLEACNRFRQCPVIPKLGAFPLRESLPGQAKRVEGGLARGVSDPGLTAAPRQIPRPAGESAGLRNDSFVGESSKLLPQRALPPP
jgi:hypothetical protein